eukprot:NODE_3587_length_756_cov_42.653465_g3007_i0.p4 GENE.NODE_3587_length_756_cov_42.653465_g3007_i0~~NODE_3587_length_756_cov_42.653465_g3007_i0.p4  ORF type:complete len:63 (-),score=6.29 NODE_3587_length_756_cov_42.653465_g3007_i0:472-660(-)
MELLSLLKVPVPCRWMHGRVMHVVQARGSQNIGLPTACQTATILTSTASSKVTPPMHPQEDR